MQHTAAKNANEAIALAKQAIASADRNLKLAAEYLAFAEEQGKTQRQIAEGVGKSAAWVNRLLQWRRDNYAEDTPFGAQSQERDERHDERIRREQEGTGSKHNSSRARSGPKRSSRARDRQGFTEGKRDTLVRILGMLGSSNDHEVLVAARKAEDMRKSIELTWDDLIVACHAHHSALAT